MLRAPPPTPKPKHGSPPATPWRTLTDVNTREFLMLSLLAVAVLWMGVHPKPFTDRMQVSVTQLLKHVSVSKAN